MRADMADCAIGGDDTELRYIAFSLAQRAREDRFCFFDIVRMKRLFPVRILAFFLAGRNIVHLAHAVVPDENVRRAVIFPYADAGCFQRQFKALGQDFERFFALLKGRDVLLPLPHQEAGQEQGRNDAERNDQAHEAELEHACGCCGPPALRNGREGPGVVAEIDGHGHRGAAGEGSVAEEDFTVARAPRDRHIERRVAVKATVGVKLLEIDDRR